MEAHSHTVRKLVAAVVAFAGLLVALSLVAGAGLAVFAFIVIAGLIAPLVVIIGAIHHDEAPVEDVLRKQH